MHATSDRHLSRDAIERFLDRSWMLEQTPVQAVKGHRFALGVLDDWLHSNRVSTLTTASASDLRALLNSRQWDAVSRRCEALLGLITRFYHSLQETHFRGDDPVATLIDQELELAARKREDKRPPVRRASKLTIGRPRAV